jgi:hypothetical protein
MTPANTCSSIETLEIDRAKWAYDSQKKDVEKKLTRMWFSGAD